MKKFKVFAAALAICAVSVTAGGCSDDNKVGKWFDQLLCTHEWDDGEVTKEATCASKGEIKYTCESCEKTKTKKTDKLPHTEVEIELEATCTKEGLTDGVKCAVCEEVLQQPKVVAKIPHFEVPNSEAVAATCTTAGLKPGTHCARCDEVITEETVIPALGHLEVPDTEVEATCTTSGLTEGKHCKRCNEVLEAQEEIPAAGHTEVTDAAVAATCTTSGKTAGKHCSVCNTVITAQETIPATGHMDSNGDLSCDICGIKKFNEVTPTRGERVAGKTYRIYPAGNFSELSVYPYQPDLCLVVKLSDGSRKRLYVTVCGENFSLVNQSGFIFEDSFGEGYRDVTFKPGTYTASDTEGNEFTFTIDETTMIDGQPPAEVTEDRGCVYRLEKNF